MWEELGEGIYASFGSERETNAYVLVGKDVALIDSGLDINARQLKEGLSSIGLSPKEVGMILHTHGHADNFGLDHLFPRAQVWMHPADATYVNSRDSSFVMAESLQAYGLKFPQIPHHFIEKQVIDLGNFSIQVLFTP
ncbi:MAG: MBL fold metallo-hydrolase, partial [archaeon]|nr:MBL fold metallo-hydrolase [archaeon]